MDKPKPKPKRRVYKPIRFGERMQPGTVEWELNRRRERKEEREAERYMAEMQAARHGLEHEPNWIWRLFFSIFERFWLP